MEIMVFDPTGLDYVERQLEQSQQGSSLWRGRSQKKAHRNRKRLVGCLGNCHRSTNILRQVRVFAVGADQRGDVFARIRFDHFGSHGRGMRKA